MTGSRDDDEPRLPGALEQRVRRLVTPLQEFIADQTVASGLLLVCAVAALVLANSPWASAYDAIRSTPAGIRVGSFELSMSLRHWVNDGLMALFFFVLGLEIKRELLAGELQDRRRARLLIVAALGGMVVPAAVYLAVSPAAAASGWGIPMATDTAFAIGVLALLGSRVPASLAAFLVGLAIIDDIGAVLVIAVFYSHDLDGTALAAAGGLFALLVLFNLAGIRRPAAYLGAGAALWYAVHSSGLHATIAGVLVAVTVPARTRYSRRGFEERLGRLLERFRAHRRQQNDILAAPSQHALVEEVSRTAKRATTPLQRFETGLETPISMLVLPTFALANAGVRLDGIAGDGSSLAVAAALGLVLGKLAGVSGACWLGLRLSLGALPDEVGMRHVAGMSLLAGMGFTMSIFIAELAFGSQPALLATAKLGVLAGTAVAGVAGYLVLRTAVSRAAP